MGTYSQEDVTIENLIENIGEETYSSPEIDLIEYFRDYPINLRTADAQELSQLPGISLLIAQRILEIIHSNPLYKISVICDDLNLSPEIELLLEHCTINIEPEKMKTNFELASRSRYRDRLETVKGLENGLYKGPGGDIYNRIITSYSNFETGVLTNKKSGESNLNEFTSFYAAYNTSNTKIIIGDFYADYGMGSLLWRQFSYRKGSEVISPAVSFGSGINPYRSSIEFAFFRGVSASHSNRIGDELRFNISGFYSDRSKSATIDTINNIATSIYTAGYFRTESEIEKKGKLNERAIGFNLDMISLHGFRLGINLLNLNYDKAIISESSNSFRGNAGTLVAANAAYNFSNNIVAFELSNDAKSNKNFKFGFTHNGEFADFSLSARYIEPEFRSPYGYHFGEFSAPANEQGLYSSFLIKLSKKMRISLFADIFNSISRTYTIPSIVRGLDLFSEINYQPDRKSKFTLRLRSDTKTDSYNDLQGNRVVDLSRKNSIRFEVYKTLSKELSGRMRCEYAMFKRLDNSLNSEGLMSFVDITWRSSERIRLNFRYSLFSTDDFNSAVYQFEYNQPGIIQTIPLYGKGSRILFGCEYRPIEIIKLQGSFMTTIKNEVSAIGTGNEQINSNLDNRFLFQIEVRIR